MYVMLQLVAESLVSKCTLKQRFLSLLQPVVQLYGQVVILPGHEPGIS